VRELAYDIEDCVDEFVRGVDTKRQQQRHGRPSCIKECARRLKALVTRHEIANQIQQLKARVVEVAEQRVRYKLDQVSSSSPCSSIRATDPRLWALFPEESQLVGIDGPRDDLASWLLMEDDDLAGRRRKVLSIYGFGGLGKTTLANEVRRKIGKQFDCEAVVPVSQKPDDKKILWNILTRVDKNRTLVHEREIWDEQRIIEEIRDLLEHKRYFIIIDDIWSERDWNLLKCALPENNMGSRIITTTRIESIAKACCSLPGDRCYKIEALSESHSRSLLFKKVFGSEDGCPDRIKHISADILRKCSGLPLAIVCIASLLASKPNMIEQWEKVRASTGYALQIKQDPGGMESILSLSYSDLPQHLKTCLLYLSVFPEDYDIERGSLLRRWIAEGFIKEEGGLIAEDVAESYFNELINRSMIIPVDIDRSGKVRVCRLHDMMLELLKSRATEENFVTIMGPGPLSTNPEGVIRRLSIQYNDREQKLEPQEMPSLTHVRSFSTFGGSYNQTLPFAYFRVLRVLSLDCQLSGADDLKIICKLHQLKYLRLNVHELPAEIGELRYLETLELCSYRGVNLLPHGVTRLQHLRHLIVNWMMLLPEAIGSMQALQTLPHFNVRDSPVSAVQELGNLKNLRDLSISWNEPAEGRCKEYLASSLNKLSSYNLQSLNIVSGQAIPVDFLASLSPPPYLLKRFWMWNSYFQRCPKWIGPLNRLTEMKLDVCEMEDEDLDLLGHLPALVHFQLWVVPLRKEKIIIKRNGFRSLNAFRLWSGLPCLVFQEKSMPRLETLELMFSACGAKSYGSTHSGIEHLHDLKNVNVTIYTDGARQSNIEAACHMIRQQIAKHPNNVRGNITYSSGYIGGVMNDGSVDEEAIVLGSEGSK